MQSQRESARGRIGSAAVLSVALTTASASAGIVVVENDFEPNNTFNTRQVLAGGASSVQGQLSPSVPFSPDDWDFVLPGSLSPGEVDSYFPFASGLERRIGYLAWTDNTVGAGEPDTRLRALDQNLSELASNDNSGLVGNNATASLLAAYTDANGNVNLQVTGGADSLFNGSHNETGDYNVYIKLRPAGDIDFLSFTDLVPGSSFDAEITTAAFDTVMGWLNEAGDIIQLDNNGGAGTLSRITGIVPASGVVTLAVTGSNDNLLIGLHPDTGDYNLNFTGTYIPAPAAALLAPMGLLIARRRRR